MAGAPALRSRPPDGCLVGEQLEDGHAIEPGLHEVVRSSNLLRSASPKTLYPVPERGFLFLQRGADGAEPERCLARRDRGSVRDTSRLYQCGSGSLRVRSVPAASVGLGGIERRPRHAVIVRAVVVQRVVSFDPCDEGPVGTGSQLVYGEATRAVGGRKAG